MRAAALGVLLIVVSVGQVRAADLALKPAPVDCKKFTGLSFAFIPAKIQKRCKFEAKPEEPLKDWQMFVTQDMGLPRAVGETFTGTLTDALKATTECTAKYHRDCIVKPARK